MEEFTFQPPAPHVQCLNRSCNCGSDVLSLLDPCLSALMSLFIFLCVSSWHLVNGIQVGILSEIKVQQQL